MHLYRRAGWTFLKTSIEGSTEELANFGSKWVDCVAAKSGAFACSSGRNSFVWSTAERAVKLEHPSTVGGLAFDPAGNDSEYRIMAVSLFGNTKKINGKS